MTDDDFTRMAQAVWSSGDWDDFSRHLRPVGELVLDRVGVGDGIALLDVGTGSGGTIAIPAALRGTQVVGSDVTPELLVHAGRRAAEAGVDIEWVPADARDLPFADDRFDRVTSTFGAMFAPDHRQAAGELLRVCRPGGTVAMTTWVLEGFTGETFTMSAKYGGPPPPGVQTPQEWGTEEHIVQTFGASGVTPTVTRERNDFRFGSLDEAVRAYTEDLGPLVMARTALEPQGRWEEFVAELTDLIRRFDVGSDGAVAIRSDYFLIVAQP